MLKPVLIFFFLNLLLLPVCNAQQTDWHRSATPAGTFITGAGPTFFGLGIKGGVFLKSHFVLGASAELHEFLSSRREAGVFLRKYLNSNRLSIFVQAGPSFGSFQEWDLDMDNEIPGTPPLYRRWKLNGSLGGEIRISPVVSIEGEAGFGRITGTSWWAPSLRSAVNIRFYKKKRPDSKRDR